MKIPSDNAANIHATRAGILRALGLRPGQTFTAQVVTHTPDGLTQLRIGSQQISLNLPSKPQIGVMLQFLFHSGGAKPQIQLMGEISKEGKLLQGGQQSQIANRGANLAQGTNTPNPPPATAPTTPTTQQAIIQQTLTNQPPPNQQAQIAQNTIIAQSANSQPHSPSQLQPQPQTTPQSAQSPNAGTIAQTNNNIPISPTMQAKLQLLPGQIISAKIIGQNQNGQTILSINQHQFTAPTNINAQTGSIAQFLVHDNGGKISLILSESNPNILNQTQGKVGGQTQINNNAQNIAMPTPNPLSQAISSAIPALVARQDSISALIANLLNLQKQNIRFDINIDKAIRALINAQTSFDAKALNGQSLKQAILQSGNFFENILAKSDMATRQNLMQGDIKSLLLALRSALKKWAGEPYGPFKPDANHPPAPSKGALPRATRQNLLQLPQTDDAKIIARSLLAQTDSALSRLKLFQISSLPEMAGRGGTGQEINIELLFSHANQNNIIRLQISKDSESNQNPNERGWNIAFAINLKEEGEVGANISFRFGKVGALIWAQKDEFADILDNLLPQLKNELEASGLDIAFLRVKKGTSEKEKQNFGKIMDNIL